MADLVPTISPSSIRQAAVNTTYATVGGIFVSKYAFGGSVLDGAKYGAGSYVAVAGAKTIYDVLGPSPRSSGQIRKPISPDNPIQKGKLGDDLNDWWRMVDENNPKTPNPPSSKPIPHAHYHPSLTDPDRKSTKQKTNRARSSTSYHHQARR